MDYLLLVVGLALLLLGANYLVDSSVAIAKRAKISNFIIGLTIVGIGTSAPELFVSIQSALTGHGDIAMGNVVGSNITNLLLILGVTAVICPFAIEKQTHRSDIPFGIFAAVLLTMFVNDSWNPGIDENILSRLDGGVLLVIFITYFIYTLFIKAKNPQEAKEEMDQDATSSLEGKKPALLWVIVPELEEHIVAGLEHGHHPVPMSESTEALGTPTVTGVIHDLDPIVEEARKDHAPTSFGAAFGHILWSAGAVTAEVYGRIVSRSVAGGRKRSAGSRKQKAEKYETFDIHKKENMLSSRE